MTKSKEFLGDKMSWCLSTGSPAWHEIAKIMDEYAGSLISQRSYTEKVTEIPKEVLDQYSRTVAIEFAQWATLNDYTYLKSKDHWVNEEQEENEITYTNDQLFEIFNKYKTKQQ